MIARDRTAIRRNDLSRPIRTALRDGVIGETTDLLDYGCGYGDDVLRLEQRGIRAFGWDPAHRPEGTRRTADVVNLGYVVNVVETQEERAEALRLAWGYANRLLIVAARLKSDVDLEEFNAFEDGYVTRLQTFQKFFEQHELRDWIEHVLGEAPAAAAPGVFYVFRQAGDREQFLASRYRRRIAAPRIRASDRLFEEHQERLQTLIAFASERGRLPEADEIQNGADIISVFGSIKRAFQIVRRVTGAEQWEAITRERRTDLLVYVALGRFPRRPAFSRLPRGLQRDIKSFFRTYKEASSSADSLLFEAGDMNKINAACSASEFGKLMPTALYVHAAGLGRLAPILRVYEGCAQVLSGVVEGTTIIKLRRHEPKISYLAYPAFDGAAHPELAFSVRVDLQSFGIKYRDFRDTENPPVLHRKELFVPHDYPERNAFAELSTEEAAHGLLDDTQAIGLKKQWDDVLRKKGWDVRGHKLIRL